MEERDGDARDAELQRRVAMGEREAFEALYRRYGPPAYGLALRVTGHALLAQEVVHDAFMALWSAPEAFDPTRGTFRSSSFRRLNVHAVSDRRPTSATPANRRVVHAGHFQLLRDAESARGAGAGFQYQRYGCGAARLE